MSLEAEHALADAPSPGGLSLEEELLEEYGDMTSEELLAVWDERNRELAFAHQAILIQVVKDGGGTPLKGEGGSVEPKGEPTKDKIVAAIYDKPTQRFYQVDLHRYEEPELFLLKDRLNYIGKMQVDKSKRD